VDEPGAELVAAATQRQFSDRARSGDWRTFMDDDAQQRYDKALSAVAPPDLVNWLHAGWLGATDRAASSPRG
jgi:hypothetical protein